MAADKLVDSSLLNSELSDIADAIRAKTGKSDNLELIPGLKNDFVTAVNSIAYGTDATADDILSGKKAYSNNAIITGNIATLTSADLIVDGKTVTIPVKKYTGSNGTSAISTSIQEGIVTSGTAVISSITETYNSTSDKFDVTGSANVSAPTSNRAGYISSSEGIKQAKTNGATVSATIDKIVGTASISATKKKPSISKQAISISGVTDAASGNATTTAPSSGVYVAVKSAENSATITPSISISTAGYGDSTNHGITGSGAAVGAAASDTTYIPIKTGSVTQNAPTINKSTGLITATSTVTEGYVGADTKSNTLQLSTWGISTYGASTTEQRIASGNFLTGVQIILALATSGISPENIKYGQVVKVGDTDNDARIHNVTGTFTATPTGKTALTAAALRTGYAGFINGEQINGSMNDTVVTEGTTTVSSTTATRGTWSQTTGYTANRTIGAATFANSATTGKTYVDISNTTSAPVLVSGDYLYINKGYTDDLKISLARLVPDGSDVKGHQEYLLSGHSAYDDDGILVAGTIPTIASTNLSVSGKTVTVPVGYYTGATGATPVSASIADGTVVASVSSNTSGSASMAANGFTAASSATDYYVSLSTTAGSVKAKAKGGNAGYITSSTTNETAATSVAVSGNGNKIYVPAGSYAGSVSSHSVTTTPVVTGATSGTVTDISSTTKPSGTNGTDYWTITPGGSVTTTGVSTAKGKATISGAGYIPTGNNESSAHTVNITPTVNNGTARYISKATSSTTNGTASATANAGTASIAKQPSASASATANGIDGGYYTDTTTSSYYIDCSASAASGYSTATGGSASASVTASSVTVGAGYNPSSVTASTTASSTGNKTGTTATSTEVTASANKKIYLKAAGVSWSGGGLSNTTNYTGTPTVSVGLDTDTSTAKGIGITDTAQSSGYFIKLTGSTAKLTGSTKVTRADYKETRTAGYLPARAETTILASTTSSPSVTVNAASKTRYITLPTATFENSATSGTTYTDISDTGPVLVSGDYLYINKGWTPDCKISLAKLVPDGSDVKGHSEYIISGHSAYDDDGILVAGSIPTLVASDISVSGATVTIPLGKYTGASSGTAVTKTISSGAVTTSFTGDGMSTYFNSGTSSDKNVTITPKYTNTAGYIAAHSTATNNGGTTYYKIKTGAVTPAINSHTITAPSVATSLTGSATDQGLFLTTAPSGEDGTDYWSIKPVGTGTDGSSVANAKATVTAGWIATSPANSGNDTKTITPSISNANAVYLPKGTYAGSVVSASISLVPTFTPEVSGTITSIGTTTQPSGTDGTDYWTITPSGTKTDGNARSRGRATVSVAGYVEAGYLQSGYKNVTITPTVNAGTATYIPKAVIAGSSTNATATTTVAPGTVSIAKQSTPSGVTNAASGNATTTAPTSGVYVAVKATAAANSTGTTSSISGSGSATVTTAGYAPTTLTGTISVSGTATAKTSAKDSSMTYVPITTVSGSIGGTASGGSATAAISNVNSMAVITDVSGKTAGTDYWTVKATATGAKGTYTPKYTVSTAGWIGSTVTGTAQDVSVSSDSTGKSIYIPKATFDKSGATVYCKTAGYIPAGSASSGVGTIGNGTVVASVSSNTGGSASMAATGFTASSSATSYYVTLSTTAGSVKAKAAGGTAGYVTSSTTNETAATSVSVSGNGNKLYIPAGSITNNIAPPQGATVTDITSNKCVSIGPGYYPSELIYHAALPANGTITNNTSGGTSSGTINWGSQIKIGAGYYSADKYYTAQAAPSGTTTLTTSSNAQTNIDIQTKQYVNVQGINVPKDKTFSLTATADTALDTTSNITVTSAAYRKLVVTNAANGTATITNNGTIDSLTNAGTITAITNNSSKTITNIANSGTAKVTSGSATAGTLTVDAYNNASTPALTGAKSVVTNGKWVINDVTASGTYYGMTVVPSTMLVPSGNIQLTQSTSTDVKAYATATVRGVTAAISGGGLSGTATASSSTATLSDSTNTSGISFTTACTATRAKVSCTASTAGWASGTIKELAQGTGAMTAKTYYINAVTLPTGKSFTINTAAGNFKFTDTDGNVTVSEV